MINVTKTYVPNFEVYSNFLRIAFENEWFTNRGELTLLLEKNLKAYLKLKGNILLTNNGTIPLQISSKVLGEQGEIITTPFSYVATTSSIVWEGFKPVFVDIEKDTWTIDPSKIEAVITHQTKAILATHVFGNPCDIEAIEVIARKHGLKIIYDAAHCFGVKYNGKTIFDFGDVSTCSFHATKLFHTGEGGAIFTNDNDLFEKIFYSHNFGHNGPLAFHGLGINAKISELQSAMGLAVLPEVDVIIQKRKKIVDFYIKELDKERLEFLKLRANTEWNYSYFPVLLSDENQLLKVEAALNAKDIYPRRYFYPSLNKLPYLNYQSMPIAENVSERVLCLPLYAELTSSEVALICELINSHL